MANHDEIIRILTCARAERSRNRAQQLLNQAIRMSEAWETTGGGVESAILKSQAFAELAEEENSPEKRTMRWNNALRALESRWKTSGDPQIAEAYGCVAVDCSQDNLSSLERVDQQRILLTARDYVDKYIDQVSDPAISGSLLARKSSILRQLSLYDLSPETRIGHLQEGWRCAHRAVEQSKQAGTILELGLSEWALARYESTDKKYVSRLRQAEKYLTDRLLENFEPGQLALTRFYRLTFRSIDACERFRSFLKRVKHVRRLLRQSHLYAEAAVQLWYANYPQTLPLVERYLSGARSLLEEAIAGGYCNARLIIALSYVRGILEGPPAGETSLSDIIDRADISWQKALGIVAQRADSDLLAEGFVLGINQSGVLTRLGTFAADFLNNEELAAALYQAAVRLGPRDPIALTNLARFLIRTGDTDSLRYARRLLQKAQSFADRRFRWWRSVLSELEQKELQGDREKKKPRKPRQEIPTPTERFENLKQLRQRFRLVETLMDSQKRGYELERLVYEMANLTFGTAAQSYRFRRPLVQKVHQIDGFIPLEHRGEKYRVECKWKQTPADYHDILTFSDKIDVVGVSGLFISMYDFEAEAVAKARELRGTKAIILVNGEEIRSVFKGEINFDDLMTRKRLHFDQRSEVYHRVAPVKELP